MIDRPRTKVGLYARDKVVETLRKTANEIEKGEDGLLKAFVLVSAGQPAAFLSDGPLVCVYTMHQTEPIPEDITTGLEQALDDVRNFSQHLKDGADS